MTGGYLETQITGYIIRPILDFRRHLIRDVLAIFEDLDGRADEVGEAYFTEVCSQPAGEYCNFDPADATEIAVEKSLHWYQGQVALRQSMLNLLAAGLFHLTEQQLFLLCQDRGFTVEPPKGTKLDAIKQWYATHLRLKLEVLPSWKIIDELRLVANAVKHAEGGSARKLRSMRPELFEDPSSRRIEQELEEGGSRSPRIPALSVPLAGADFFITETVLSGYAAGVESFFVEIANHFNAHRHIGY